MGPFDVEVDVIRAPDDQCRSLQGLQFWFDRDGVLFFKGHHEALDITRTLVGSKKRPKIRFVGLFRLFRWTRIGWSQSFGRPIDGFVREHRFQRSTQASGSDHRNEGLERLWWPVVMRVAVCESQAPNPFGIECCEDLRYAPTAVITDEIHLVDV